MNPGCGTISLHNTTRALGWPSRVLVASTMALGLGWVCAATACASHWPTSVSGSAGSGSGSVSVCSAIGQC